MKKLTANDLKKIKDRVRKTTQLREGAGSAKITVHMGTCGIASGARSILNELLKIFKEQDVSDVIIATSGCAGLCSREPMVTVELARKSPVKYINLTEDKIRKIFKEHVIEGKIVQEFALAIGSERTHLGIQTGDKSFMPYQVNLMICAGTSCVSNGSYQVKEALLNEIEKRGLNHEIQVVATGCNGFCPEGPIMVVQPGNIFYRRLTKKDVTRLVEEHFIQGKPIKEFMFVPPKEEVHIAKMSDIEFFKHQRLIALRNRGLINPEKIDEAIGRDGYEGLAKALLEMNPEEIIVEVKKSKIRGRGGAGFLTGVKWEFCRNAPGDEKYLICNADEGDPGAFMDRSILETDPHAVLEGMIITSKAIGASHGIFYVRDEYPLALKLLQIAVEQAETYGLLGDDIMGSGHNFHVEFVRGGGAFVCGEETALIASVEGWAGRPRPRPPFPAQKGLWGKPTVINNVETLSNIPAIIRNGGKWYSNIGTKTSRGTKVFSLVGKVNNTGLVEVPMGTPLKRLIYDIGGGIPEGKKFKAVQSGGPSGGCLPEHLIDLPVDYEELAKAGSIMGSGGLIVMDETSCMVDVSHYFLGFLLEESCGKCTPCREGVFRMHEILTDITEGNGTFEQLDLLEELAQVVKDASLCALGGTAPNPVLSTLRYFRDEYEAHIKEKSCPALVCKNLISYYIEPDKCVGCLLCKKSCPADAISGEGKEVHIIDQDICTKCGACFDICPPKVNAVIKLTGEAKEKLIAEASIKRVN